MNIKTPMLYAHIGDLYITNAKEQNYIDLLSIIAQIETECYDKLDFVYLPGDNADNGLPEQYTLVEEGPVGYSLISVDGDVESWRFKPFHDAFPYVMITSPADYRLLSDGSQEGKETIEVHAVVSGRRVIKYVKCSTDRQNWVIMDLCDDNITWLAKIKVSGATTLTVMVTDESGRPGLHTIELRSASTKLQKRIADGSDADTIGPWPENGIFGTQLGPNRNGKPS